MRHLLALLTFFIATGTFAQSYLTSSRQLVQRVIPQRAGAFVIEALSADTGRNSFELESRGSRIVLRGNNGVAIASALYYYLTEYCHCQSTWNGSNLRLPVSLPRITGKIRRSSPYQYRYYLNYCTFNYSMSWWDWDRWQQEIDWMALHGINMPLAITGEEYTWYRVYHKMGFTDEELKDFFSGPAYFAWFWMGNLDGWGGPLPMHWMESQKELQKKILARERELGMTPVLPAFTGHVPPSFPSRFPSARCKSTNWKNGFKDTWILDAADPLFADIGQRFLNEQAALFGTDHFYSADTFNENEPPSDDPAFLSGLSKKIYEGMQRADPRAVWVMQGWLFYSDRKFWKAPQIQALLDAVPNDNMLLLDLAAEIEPVWKRTGAFYGKPWVWNMLNNFGGNVNLFGRMDGVAAGPALALHDSTSGKMKGIGLTMEGIATNPVIYELMMQHTWQTEPIDLRKWLIAYIRNRYGYTSPGLERSWEVLRNTAYNGKLIRDGAESIITGRPTLDSTTVWTRTLLNYAPADLLPAWDGFVTAATKQPATEGFRFDLVDLTRQVLANYASVLQRKWVQAFREDDTATFDIAANGYLRLIDDLDRLLATQKDLMLGPWLADARKKGITPDEQALYERNARDLITLWGDANSPLHEYACRQWSGLLKDFYYVRWEKFLAFLRAAMTAGRTPDFAGFEKDIRQWEWSWVNEQRSYPTSPTGDPVAVVKQLYTRYRSNIGSSYLINIKDLGAVGDGKTDNTRAIQSAIDQATAQGGATVLVPAGRWLTGVLTLRSNVFLRLSSGAVLLGSTHRMDYGPGNAEPLIRADHQSHIGIEGEGTIDGQGEALLEDLYQQIRAGRIADNEWQTPNPWGQVRPAEENRPKLILFKHCDDISIKGITLKNALDWVQDYKSCTGLTVDSIRVESNTFWNNDGIDIVDCKKVRVTNSVFNADDDGICLKSEDRNDSCSDVYIAHCKVRSSASAIKFGTASRGGFLRITIRDIDIYDTYRSAVALEAVDGGRMEDVDIRDIKATNTGNAVFIRLGHRNKDSVYSRLRRVYIGNLTTQIPAGKPDQGYPMEGPLLRQPHSVFPAVIAGLPGHPVEDVVLENITVSYPGSATDPDPETHAIPENPSDYPEFSMFGELPAWGLYTRHVNGLTLKNVRLSARDKDYRPERHMEDTETLRTIP